MGETEVVPSCACLGCGKVHDRATGLNDSHDAAPGDITICIKCGHVMAYDDDMKFRELTDEEVIAVAGDPRIVEFNRLRARYKQ
jgi:hypothetical protein